MNGHDGDWSYDLDFQMPTGERVSLDPERAMKLLVDIGQQLVGRERIGEESHRHREHRQGLALDERPESPLRPDELVARSTAMVQDALALSTGECPAYCDEQLPAACKRPWGGVRMYWVCDHVPTSHMHPYP